MASSAINALKDAFSGEQLILAGTDDVFAQEMADVDKFVTVVRPFALDGSAPFAIRGAGQQPLPGCANIQDGITLDLRFLTGIEIKDGIVSIAAGERWGTVFEKVEEQGLGVAGGRSAQGGIGGLALSGGLSFFSSREGFICDNVTNYEVVLASGKVVNVNADENPDLWKALRGFLLGRRRSLLSPSFPGQVEALVNELKKPDASEETYIMLSIGYSAAYLQLGGTLCMNQLYYTGATETSPAVLEPFATVSPQIDQLNSMRAMTLTGAVAEQAQQGTDATRCAYINTTVKADIATLQAAADMYVAALEPIKGCEGITCSLTLQPYAASLLAKSASQGGNVLGLAPSDGPLVSILALAWWKDKADDEEIIKTFREVIEVIDRDAASRGTSVLFKYMNYAWGFQDPIDSYGIEDKQALQEASRKYDPEGLFQKGVPGGFKLFLL
ncbi:hypothetical protein VMCG_02683 [Cytospora schulzeri]|uniref:FAD-binding PCMH-type domain-containing protein n=1 Tax=Cytospora schulzeri TaxID=448051 RepID=A0A423WZU0_9PEZI|nr:hypothetical protein VMCG_02683 [Valsa malicola]